MGFDDIADGAEVVISDDSGKTLQIVQLQNGTPGGGACTFTFSAKIPAGKGYYGITVTHRGTVKFTESDMVDPQLTIGD